MTAWDLAVVGAGPAGAATAIGALRVDPSIRVALLDRGGYGSDTLSSHALMRGAVNRLHRWGMLDRVWQADTPIVRRASFRYGREVVDIDIAHRDLAHVGGSDRVGDLVARLEPELRGGLSCQSIDGWIGNGLQLLC